MPARPPWDTQPGAFRHRQTAHPIPSTIGDSSLHHTLSHRCSHTTDMRAAFLVLLLWAVACAHPVPGHEPTHPSTLQEDTANDDYIGKLGNHLDGGDGRHPPDSSETGENALARDLTGGNALDEELGELSGRVGQAQHVNQVDHEDTGTHNGNDLGFLEGDARDTDDGDNADHYGAGANMFPSQGGGFLDEEDDSGDDTFDANGEEERGEGPTYIAGADGAGEHEHDAGRGDAGAGGGHGDSSSSSSSESIGADHRRYRNHGFGRAYRHRGASSSSQEEDSYDFQDEAMQGDDPSVFDGPGSSYRMRHAGPHALGNSWESAQGPGSHHWEEGDSRSPEVEDGDSGEDSPSVEDNSQSEEPVDSQSEEKSSSHSQEDEDGEDSPSREDEDSESRDGTDEQSDEEPGEIPEVVRTLNEHSNSQTWEGQEDWDSAEDRSVLSTPDSESREEEGELSKSTEDDDDQSQSTEDTVEESEEDGNDSAPSTSAESPESPEGDSSPEDNTGEDSRSTESDNSESQEDDDDVESHSQEDATRESSSHGDDSSLQSLESGARKRRPGALRHRPAADYDDNDCQDGY